MITLKIDVLNQYASMFCKKVAPQCQQHSTFELGRNTVPVTIDILGLDEMLHQTEREIAEEGSRKEEAGGGRQEGGGKVLILDRRGVFVVGKSIDFA